MINEESSIKSEVQLYSQENGESKSQEELKISVISEIEEFDNIAQSWKNLVDATDTYIFQTYEWNRVWWKHFGKGSSQQLNILLFYQGEALVGIAPLFLDKVKLFGFTFYSCLRFLGSTVNQPGGEDLKGLLPYSDYMDLIIRPGFEDAVMESFNQYFRDSYLGFDEIVLNEVPENSSLWTSLMPILREQESDFLIEQSSGCPIIKLDCTWDEHLDSMSKRSRYRTRRFIKQANKPDYKIFDIEKVKDTEGMKEAYEQLVQLHQKRWKELGYPGIFDERRMYEFLKEITVEFFRYGWSEFRLVRPTEGNRKCIAVDLLFKYKKRTYLVQRALDADSPAAEHGPGNVSLYVMLKEAAEENVQEFDLLRGTEKYKFRSANDMLKNNTITIKNPQKDGRFNFGYINKFIHMRRRLRLEFEQLKIFLSGEKNIFNNIHAYGTFLYKRLNIKFSSKG